MSDVRQWSREFFTEFIQLYRDSPGLWNINSNDYNQREVRNKAYSALVSKYRELDPEATRDSVAKKINSIRSVHRRELVKVRNSERSATDPSKIYKPGLWYYDLLSFLAEQDAEKYSDLNTAKTIKRPTLQPPASPPPAKHKVEEKESPHTVKALHPAISGVNEGQTYIPVCVSEECDAVSTLWATKIRKLVEDQRVLAENLITQVLTKAYFGELTRRTLILDTVPSKTELRLPRADIGVE